MKPKLVYLCGTIIFSIVIVLSFGSCKNFGVPDFDLRVTVGEGVSGSPTSGTYTYRELSEISYIYTPENTDYTVEVLVNGSRWATNGTINIYNHTDLQVRIFDIRGVWDVTMLRPTSSTEDPFKFKMTIRGLNYLSGDFIDDRGYRGLWSISGATVIISFDNWQNYILTGSIPVMSGTWTGESTNSTWSAVR